jgi:tRNA dimethylallyltransferase
MKYSPIVVIAGPTATGKTDLAIKLSKEFNGYIINGDSRQVFEELNIGTSKPTQEEMKKANVDFFLFGHRSVKEKYNLYQYQKEVFEILEANNARVAFLVGGTGLYIDSVVYNYTLQQSKSRKNLEGLSIDELKARVGKNLKKLNKSDQNNPRRLIRFLEKDFEVYKKGQPLKHLYLVLQKDFDVLEKEIEERIGRMFENGLLKENEILKNENVNTIGYKEFQEYFEGKISIEEVKERIYINTRKYAKRQLTWFKRNKEAIWIKDFAEALRLCKSFLTDIFL